MYNGSDLIISEEGRPNNDNDDDADDDNNHCPVLESESCRNDHNDRLNGINCTLNSRVDSSKHNSKADVKSNVDVNSFNKPQSVDSRMAQSPITRCIMSGNHRLLLECMNQGEDPNTVCSNSGRSYLHLIAQTAAIDRELTWVPMIYQLSNSGAGMSVQDNSGVTACSVAVSRKLVQIVAALLKCGAELHEADWFHAEQIRGVVKAEMMETMRRLSPSYWMAVSDLTPFKVNRLVKAWARINVSRKRLTLIEYAKETARDPNIVKLLVQHEASVELAHAVMAGDRERVKTLLCDSAVDLNTSDTSIRNNTFEPVAPLSLNGVAIKLGHVDILNELIAAKERWKSSSASSMPSYTYTSIDDGKGFGSRSYGYSGRGRLSLQENSISNPTVVFYKGKSGSGGEVCEIRTVDKPVTSALCSIL